MSKYYWNRWKYLFDAIDAKERVKYDHFITFFIFSWPFDKFSRLQNDSTICRLDRRFHLCCPRVIKKIQKSFCHQFYILNNYVMHNVIVLFPSDRSISVQKCSESIKSVLIGHEMGLKTDSLSLLFFSQLLHPNKPKLISGYSMGFLLLGHNASPS